MIDTGLKSKVATVTGANNPYGIGAAIARALASQGSNIFIHYYSHEIDFPIDKPNSNTQDKPGIAFFFKQQTKNADEVINSIQEIGSRVYSMEGNLSNPSLVIDLFNNAENKFGPVDILVINAAEHIADTFLPGIILKNEEPL